MLRVNQSSFATAGSRLKVTIKRSARSRIEVALARQSKRLYCDTKKGSAASTFRSGWEKVSRIIKDFLFPRLRKTFDALFHPASWSRSSSSSFRFIFSQTHEWIPFLDGGDNLKLKFNVVLCSRWGRVFSACACESPQEFRVASAAATMRRKLFHELPRDFQS